MDRETADQISSLVPLAVEWATVTAEAGLARGIALDVHQLRIATAVGVAQPERIRLMTVPKIPRPAEGPLGELALKTNLLGPQTIGLALGYSVFIREGEQTTRLLSHEFRHVHQYESAGSIEHFIPRYLAEIVRYGYEDSPLEIDARQHELSA
jgi:hypothetical protein